MDYSTWSDKELYDEVDDCCDGLTSWESEFHESVGKQVKQGRTLSEKQRGVLARIIEQRSADVGTAGGDEE